MKRQNSWPHSRRIATSAINTLYRYVQLLTHDNSFYLGSSFARASHTEVHKQKPTIFLLLHRAHCYDYFFYTNSYTLLHTLKTPVHINLYEPCVLYIGRAYRYPPDVAFYIFLSTNISTEYFKHAAHSPFFSSKCRLFHNATFFGFCIIHILHTGCAKI